MAPPRPADPSLTRCFAPFFGMFLGAMLGWFAMYSPDAPTSPHTWLGRIQAVTNSMIMWSFFSALLQDREIFGGGLVEKNEASRTRLQVLGVILFFVWAAGLIAFLKNMNSTFVGFTALLFCLLFGEVGWRDPIKIYSAFLRK